MINSKPLQVALVHDWFVGGGAEQVVEQLHKLYPEAPIYTAYCSPQWRQRLGDARIITSYMQHWPFSKLRKFLPPLRAWWFSHLDLSKYDLVISSSGAEAKGVKIRSSHIEDSRSGKISRMLFRKTTKAQPTNYDLRSTKAMHIAYIHAPTHYYWSRYDDYIASPGFGRLDWLARLGLKILLGPMRRWDYKAAQRPTHIIANSNYTKDQIKKYYARDSVVIHPPVDIKRFQVTGDRLQPEPRRGFIITGRQTPYKKIDLAVAACSQLELPLLVLGDGPQHAKLEKLAGKSITFLRGKSDEELAHYLQTSLAFIFPGIDDFGIAAVEALAAGTPVIAYQAGGALDYVEPGQTGEFFSQQTVDSLATALSKFNPSIYKPARIQKTAAQFSPQNFQASFKRFIEKQTS